MSWPTGVCEVCKKHCDYRWSWGYEKPHGLEVQNGRLLCRECRRKQRPPNNELNGRRSAKRRKEKNEAKSKIQQ